jgi:hypothetical protein
MKAIKIIYWVLTVIIALMMTYSAYVYLTNDQIKQAFALLSFPAYFRIELAVAKLVGVVTLLLPVIGRVKERMYAGFAIVFVSAFTAHNSSDDPAAIYLIPVVFLVLLAGSYLSYQNLQLYSDQKVKLHTELSKSFTN